MSTLSAEESTRWFLDKWRGYVLEPVETAVSLLDRELSELTAERDALEAFLTRLRTVEPRKPTATPVGHHGNPPADDPVAELRDAYTDTVLAVDHFDSVYGETLVENVTMEFGPDYGAIFHPDSDVQFIPPVKEALEAVTRKAIEERVSLGRAVESERDSVSTHRDRLEDAVDTLDSTVVPEWYRETFTDEVDAMLRDRQAMLHSKSQQFDPHEFCTYLYGDEPWRYPVLTGLARLLESVDTTR